MGKSLQKHSDGLIQDINSVSKDLINKLQVKKSKVKDDDEDD